MSMGTKGSGDNGTEHSLCRSEVLGITLRKIAGILFHKEIHCNKKNQNKSNILTA